MRIIAGLLMCLALRAGAAELEPLNCRNDSDCVKLGEGYQCVTQKTGCPDNPSMSTCAERICRKAAAPKVVVASNPIAPRHLACAEDKDCALVLTGCHCMYCARPGDLEAGIVAAANKKFAKQYENLSKCSSAQMKSCSMAGACAMMGESIPVCQARQCTVVFKPHEYP